MRGAGALVMTQMMLLLSDHDSLRGVSWPFVCKLVHCFLSFATWGGYSYDLAI
jgi:asparagine N-glycosylation enzyme membrane subunit Stt3